MKTFVVWKIWKWDPEAWQHTAWIWCTFLNECKICLKPRRHSLQRNGQDSWTVRGAGWRRAAIRMLCLCMKSCGGISSVVAGGTKVWMRRNGHQREMESSFSGGRHAHTCAGCLHWDGTLHADAFQHSRWAHQIRILVFMLDFSLTKHVHKSVPASTS